MNQTINSQINRIKNIIVSCGDDIVVELKPRLVVVRGETKWVIEPNIRGAESLTAQQFIRKKMTELYFKIVPIGRETLKTHERNFILYTAKTAAKEESARRWVKDFVKDKTEAYLADKGFLRNDVSNRLKSLCVNNGYEKINNVISMGITNNENPALIRGRIRENVFGLKKGEVSGIKRGERKGLTSHADMIMRTELSYAERNVNREVMRQDDEKIGVRLHFYGGPCNSGICPSIISSGFNVKVSGSEITADFFFDTGVPWPPYHPRCHCGILRYLYKRDFEKREGGGTIPDKFKEKIFIEDKKIKYGRAA